LYCISLLFAAAKTLGTTPQNPAKRLGNVKPIASNKHREFLKIHDTVNFVSTVFVTANFDFPCISTHL
jgi:hypothetical protein